ncbi:MAG: phosphoribosyltransferase family protein [Campylobacterota bacterium]|nr:phosphoribosyltransferase family protein [Campylobacterota bacterium]
MKQYYSYENFTKDTNSLIKELNPYEVEVIVGIARGGLTLSHCIAEGLEIRDVQTIRTELYDDTCKRQEISVFGSCHFESVKKVLVVDDIADSGETLKEVMSYLESSFSDVEFMSATLFYKKSSIYKPNFWINEAHNWIEFFWEKDFL